MSEDKKTDSLEEIKNPQADGSTNLASTAQVVPPPSVASNPKEPTADKKKSTSWPHEGYVWVALVLSGCFIAFAVILIMNTWPRSQKQIVEATIQCFEKNIFPASDKKQTLYIITQKDLDSAMRAVAYAAHQEIKQDYDDRFSILITLLTIFGIAWPLVVAFVQHKFNERDLDKIEEAVKTATDASEKANEASEKANEASEKATDASKKATDASTKANEASEKATDASEKATDASEKANEASEKATDASKKATDASTKANEASAKANAASAKADAASKGANEALEQAKESQKQIAENMAETYVRFSSFCSMMQTLIPSDISAPSSKPDSRMIHLRILEISMWLWACQQKKEIIWRELSRINKTIDELETYSLSKDYSVGINQCLDDMENLQSILTSDDEKQEISKICDKLCNIFNKLQ